MTSIGRLPAPPTHAAICTGLRRRSSSAKGPAHPQLVMIGEQPEDKEDVAGHPFVGPAGHLLDRALEAAGIVRDRVPDQAVKHFKWKRGNGKVRVHQKPSKRGGARLRALVEAELAALQPQLVVLLGATAAQAVLGPKVRVARDRGVVQPARSRCRTPRSSPSIRQRSCGMRSPSDVEFDALVRDLRTASEHLA